MSSTKSAQKAPELFECIFCDYKCCKKSDWSRHILTRKHKNKQISTENKTKGAPEEVPYECLCGKKYKERTGLWKHKKKCEQISKPLEIEESEDSLIQYNNDHDLVLHLLNQNKQLQEQIIHFLEKSGAKNK